MNNPKEKVNPWIHIWVQPRKIIRHAIEQKWMKLAVILAVIAGINSGWNETISQASDSGYRTVTSVGMTILTVFLVGAIMGIFAWLFISAIVTIVGKWLGGVGEFKHLLIAIGVSNIPAVFLLLINLISYALIGNTLFTGGAINGWQAFWLLCSGIIVVVITIWSVFIVLKAIGEAHRFSAWRALATIVIPVIIIILVVSIFTFAVLAVF